uniref:hypothetical protein n=1 Tax=Flavobacterium sp. TaxID=239 RepID=UPI0037BF1432
KSFNDSKVLTDSTNSTDNATKVVDKRVNDTTTTSKTVTAYKQDYYLSDYIAPGYFGTIYNL